MSPARTKLQVKLTKLLVPSVPALMSRKLPGGRGVYFLQIRLSLRATKASADRSGARYSMPLRRSMRVGMIDTRAIRQRWELVGSKLDERGRRMFAAGEVRAAGWGGLGAGLLVRGLGPSAAMPIRRISR
jgi:hypothetical protein